MKSVVRLVALAGTLLLAAACAPPAPAGMPTSGAGAVLVPDTTGMTFLVADMPGATPRQKTATAALRFAMEQANYRVALDPSETYDVEVLLRVDVASSEIDAEVGTGHDVDFNDKLRCTLSAVSHNIVLATSTVTFASKNDSIAPSDLTPALNKLGAAPRLTSLAASIRRVSRTTASTL